MRDSPREQDLQQVADACLAWLAADVDELERFMALAGYSPQSLRASLGSEALATGLLEYFVRNEPLLLAMSANANLPVDWIMRVWHRYNPET
ncbi:DUF3572 family protein [Pelagibacterium montanilacus]|uniref:DUF3572 family protein n=1 Tax=Pelagibacterium montanilacus TaxID=2185280 RepID=UPI0013DF0F99|nr:DUF3572 family protein [Pelagibacterium montanilacus]